MILCKRHIQMNFFVTLRHLEMPVLQVAHESNFQDLELSVLP